MVRRHSAESRKPRAGAERATSTGEVTPAAHQAVCFFNTSTHSELSPAEPPCDDVNTEQRLAPRWMSRDERKGKSRRPETSSDAVKDTGSCGQVGSAHVCVNVITQ